MSKTKLVFMVPCHRLVPFPPRGRAHRRFLKPEGQEVEYNSWWRRREAQGDCLQKRPKAEKPTPSKGAKKKAEK